MAILSKSEQNALRKTLRLLALREHQGDPTYDEHCETVARQVREMLTPVEKFELHMPQGDTRVYKVVWYETAADTGIKHLYLTQQGEAQPQQGAA